MRPELTVAKVLRLHSRDQPRVKERTQDESYKDVFTFESRRRRDR